MSSSKSHKDELPENGEGLHRFENIIGKSSAMVRIFHLMAKVAEFDTNVFLLGEPGTGKELIARTIHSISKRKNRAFVPVNCHLLPENLFAKELFGNEKRGFNGASIHIPGLLEFADGGTLYFDEICEITPSVQIKLLGVLKDKRFLGMGNDDYIEIDLRIMSASNRNLPQMLNSGVLRKDFFYRLNVIAITVPPLRERKEDISLLSSHFLNQYLKSTHKEIKGISDKAMQCLEEHTWPGNVSELENVIERAISVAKNDRIDAYDLQF